MKTKLILLAASFLAAVSLSSCGAVAGAVGTASAILRDQAAQDLAFNGYNSRDARRAAAASMIQQVAFAAADQYNAGAVEDTAE